MTTITVTTAKSRLLSLLRRAHDLHESYSITHNGRPYAIILNNDDYEGLLETNNILKDKALTRNLLRSLKNADDGKTLSFDQVAGRPQRK